MHSTSSRKRVFPLMFMSSSRSSLLRSSALRELLLRSMRALSLLIDSVRVSTSSISRYWTPSRHSSTFGRWARLSSRVDASISATSLPDGVGFLRHTSRLWRLSSISRISPLTCQRQCRQYLSDV